MTRTPPPSDRRPSRFDWERWWFRAAPPHALALFRIVFGSWLFLYWSLNLPYVPVLFSTAGLAMPIADQQDGWPAAIVGLIATPPPPVAYFAVALLLLSFVGIVLGVLFKPACAAALLLLSYIWASSQHWFWFTFEQLTFIFLGILLFSGADRTLSLRMRRSRGSWWAWEPVSILPQRLLSVQITATFLGAGWLKLTMPDWQDGTIVAHAFMDRWATPLAFWVSRRQLPPWAFDWFALGLRYFEMSLPFGLWSPWWRWFLAAATGFLVVNSLMLSFWWFLVLIPAYVVFCAPEKVAEAVDAYGRSRGRGSAADHGKHSWGAALAGTNPRGSESRAQISD